MHGGRSAPSRSWWSSPAPAAAASRMPSPTRRRKRVIPGHGDQCRSPHDRSGPADGDRARRPGDVRRRVEQTLTVRLGQTRTGLEPPVVNTGDCHFDAPSLQYVRIEFATPPGLAAHVEIGTGPQTPAGIRRRRRSSLSPTAASRSTAPTSRCCPRRDKFLNEMGARNHRHSVGRPSTRPSPRPPAGPPEVFPTLQLRISRFRLLSDVTSGRQSGPRSASVSAACPDDAAEICVPLG